MPSRLPSSTAPAWLAALALAAAPAAARELRMLEAPWAPAGGTFPARTGAALLEMGDGRFLVAGGEDEHGVAQPWAFVFTPHDHPDRRRVRATRRGLGGYWKRTAPMHRARSYATVENLRGGKVLIAGGFDEDGRPLRAAEVFDPRRGTFHRVRPMETPRAGAASVRLKSGKVLVVGGYRKPGVPTATMETYDPPQDSFDPHPWRLGTPAAFPAVARLMDGDILISGGFDGVRASDQLLLFDDIGGPFHPYAGSPRHPYSRGSLRVAGRLAGPRAGHRMRTIGEVVLIAGGVFGEPCREGEAADPVEVWDAARPYVTSAFEPIAPLDDRRPRTLPDPLGGTPVHTGLPGCTPPEVAWTVPMSFCWIFPADARTHFDGRKGQPIHPPWVVPTDRTWPDPCLVRDPRPAESADGYPDLVASPGR